MFGALGRHDQVLCPRCLRALKPDTHHPRDTVCTECKFVIPSEYVANAGTARPLFLELFGWPQVGKTTYLDVLRLHLYYISNVWSRCSAEPVTELDYEHQRILLQERNAGLAPAATKTKPRNLNDVYIMKLNHMERWDSRFLVIMDHGGEMFEEFSVPVDEIPFLTQTPTAILMISLTELAKHGHRFDNPVQLYIRALQDYGVNFAKDHRQVVVVLAKADLITDLPPNLSSYLQSDNLGSILPPTNSHFPLEGARLAEYVERMARVSLATERWIEDHVEGGRSGILMLGERNIETRFALVSSTGRDLLPGVSPVSLAPRRVLDPFFWALELQKGGQP